jgi:hypothetical protein
MDGNRWQQIEALPEASRLAAGQPASFIRTSSKGDGAEQEVWSLGCRAETERLLEEPAKR